MIRNIRKMNSSRKIAAGIRTQEAGRTMRSAPIVATEPSMLHVSSATLVSCVSDDRRAQRWSASNTSLKNGCAGLEVAAGCSARSAVQHTITAWRSHSDTCPPRRFPVYANVMLFGRRAFGSESIVLRHVWRAAGLHGPGSPASSACDG